VTATVNQVRLNNFRREFGGTIVVPEDQTYDEARTIFNAMIGRRPAVIAQCVTTTLSPPSALPANTILRLPFSAVSTALPAARSQKAASRYTKARFRRRAMGKG
jgi:hypothetical protein